MKKPILTLLTAAAVFTAAMAGTAMAGEWKQDLVGWWYQNDDGGYYSNGWNWIDGRCYYFTPEGYCLLGTQTPDGYTVDGSGAWTVDGVVQVREPATQAGSSETASSGTVSAGTSGTASDDTAAAGEILTSGSLSFRVPDGWVAKPDEDGGYTLVDGNDSMFFAFNSLSLYDIDPDLDASVLSMMALIQESLFDEMMEESIGTPTSKTTASLNSGTWYVYQYASATFAGDLPDFGGNVNVFLRLYNTEVQMVMIVHETSTGLEADNALMNQYMQ